ncbi:protein TPX2 isoform X2 [Hibiscus syriacus]|uniref:protein TPX2 isoform X2 n=1 Tax=Hibiscus syriacus TaxID=106335 RepID=UPI001920BEA5|nr:protein TPX2 isoform X2 [Hibiscus syriacus]
MEAKANMERSNPKSAFKITPKPPAKENTRPQEFKLHTGQRAVKRAMFNYSVATKFYLSEVQKRQVEKVQKMIEDEEIRSLRKEMVPKAQLMPFFDRPFFPQRSNRPLTIPREPSFRSVNSKCWSCISENELYYFQHAHAWNPIK